MESKYTRTEKWYTDSFDDSVELTFEFNPVDCPTTIEVKNEAQVENYEITIVGKNHRKKDCDDSEMEDPDIHCICDSYRDDYGNRRCRSLYRWENISLDCSNKECDQGKTCEYKSSFSCSDLDSYERVAMLFWDFSVQVSCENGSKSPCTFPVELSIKTSLDKKYAYIYILNTCVIIAGVLTCILCVTFFSIEGIATPIIGAILAVCGVPPMLLSIGICGPVTAFFGYIYSIETTYDDKTKEVRKAFSICGIGVGVVGMVVGITLGATVAVIMAMIGMLVVLIIVILLHYLFFGFLSFVLVFVCVLPILCCAFCCEVGKEEPNDTV